MFSFWISYNFILNILSLIALRILSFLYLICRDSSNFYIYFEWISNCFWRFCETDNLLWFMLLSFWVRDYLLAVWYFTSTNFTVLFWRYNLSFDSAFSYVYCFLFYFWDYDFALKRRYSCASMGFLGWHGECTVYFYWDFFKLFSFNFWILSNFCIAFWKETLIF